MDDASHRWKLDGRARTYLDGVRGAIPGAVLQLAVMGKICEEWCPNPTRILDLGCGDGIIGRYLLDRFPSARATFIDFSDPMLEAVRAKVRDESRAKVLKADFASPSWLGALGTNSRFDIVVSGFAIHHQPDDRKRGIYSEVFGLLGADGVFLNLEHVASATAAGERVFDEFFVDYLREFNRASGGASTADAAIDAYYKAKEENLLAPAWVQCRWLEEIGFTDVDCYFKVFELSLFGGRRPS
jgi:tRNA (cmo5U34)-methyltransferase